MVHPVLMSAPASRPLILASYLAVCTIWGSTYLAIAIAVTEIPPYLLGALRFTLAGALVLLFARLRGEPWPSARQWGIAAICGLCLFGMANGFIAAAERSVSSGLASIVASMTSLWMVVIGRLFGEPTNRRELAGVALGLVGVAVLNASGELRANPSGLALLAAAPLAWAVGSLIGKRANAATGAAGIGAQMLTGGVQMALVSLALGERLTGWPSNAALGAAVYLFVAGSLIGFSAYAYLSRHTRPVVATSYVYVNPVIALALGALFADERFEAVELFGAAIILAAIVLVGLSRASAPAVKRDATQPAARDET